MPGFLTDHVNNMILDCLFGGRAIDPPATLFVGLSLARASRGGAVAEPRGGGYLRVAVPNDLAHFPPAAWGIKANAEAVRFPPPTGDWGRLASVFLADSAIGGQVLAMADLPKTRVVEASDRAPTVAVNALLLSHA